MDACLPDLETLPASAPPPSSVLTGETICGDGLIDLSGPDAEACDPGEAGAPGCTRSCTIDCDGGVIDPSTNHCYQLAGNATDYEAALRSCGKNSHLVTFSGEPERAFVAAAFAAKTSSAMWVGLQERSIEHGTYTSVRSNVEPGWAPDCSGCFAHLDPDASDIPARGVDAGSCIEEGLDDGGAATADHGSYFKVPCVQANARAVVCEREPPGASIEPCSGGFCAVIQKTKDSKRYFYGPAPVSAAEAATSCANLGGRLAVFDSTEERESVIAEVQRVVQATGNVWIGLSTSGAPFADPDGGGASSYRWDDDASESSKPSVWGKGEPKNSAGGARAAALVLLLSDSPLDLDLQLARATPVTDDQLLPFLCEY